VKLVHQPAARRKTIPVLSKGLPGKWVVYSQTQRKLCVVPAASAFVQNR
jgi:hypothetical protein